MEDIDHVFTQEDYRTLTNYKAFSQFIRSGLLVSHNYILCPGCDPASLLRTLLVVITQVK